ncbi:hypothetical protein RJT34_22434 [Clitoria ternatea]|uniref:Uncharacterized protein n=1 Tax=Clitoria ternatea TaxID=43366 RepID=A0AAN9IW72_CLITE
MNEVACHQFVFWLIVDLTKELLWADVWNTKDCVGTTKWLCNYKSGDKSGMCNLPLFSWNKKAFVCQC